MCIFGKYKNSLEQRLVLNLDLYNSKIQISKFTQVNEIADAELWTMMCKRKLSISELCPGVELRAYADAKARQRAYRSDRLLAAASGPLTQHLWATLQPSAR